jgi:hypothetical protein
MRQVDLYLLDCWIALHQDKEAAARAVRELRCRHRSFDVNTKCQLYARLAYAFVCNVSVML